MDNTSLQHWMSRFVLEVRKRDGTEYPPNTLYHIICGLQRYIRGSRPEVDFFQDRSFGGFRAVLDSEMKRVQKRELGPRKDKQSH